MEDLFFDLLHICFSLEMPKSKFSVELDAANVTWLSTDVAIFSSKIGELLLLTLIYDGRYYSFTFCYHVIIVFGSMECHMLHALSTWLKSLGKIISTSLPMFLSNVQLCCCELILVCLISSPCRVVQRLELMKSKASVLTSVSCIWFML